MTFAQGMIPHHEQAIEMSDMLLAKQGIDPQVVSLANEIKAAQGPEIEQMKGWLSQWGVSPTTTNSPSSSMPGMPGHDMPGGDMPGMSGGHGMMSEQDMAALQNAQGTEASRLFLYPDDRASQGRDHDGAAGDRRRSVPRRDCFGALDRVHSAARKSPRCRGCSSRCN